METRTEKILEVGLKVGDNTFYKFKSLDLLPGIRLETYLARHHEFEELGIRKEHLIAFCQVAAEFGNNGQHMEVQRLIGYMDSLLQKPVTLHPTIYLASPLIILNDEPIKEIDNEFEIQKRNLALSNPEIESFFLNQILVLKPSLRDSLEPGQQLVYSSPRQRIVEELFQQAISGHVTTT